MIPIRGPDYQDHHLVAVPESPRGSNQIVARGDSQRGDQNFLPRRSVSTIAEMADHERYEARIQLERATAYEAMSEQRQSFEHADTAYQLKSKHDTHRAEERTRVQRRI